MFEQTFVNQGKTNKGSTLAFSAFIQVLFVCFMILLPIIFTDVPKEDISQVIEGVKLSGVALRPATSKQPAVAAATTLPNTSSSGDYIASKNSNLYHHISCAAAKRILPAHARYFKTPQEAEGVGLTPSKCTLELKK